ncbi:serine hydrolase [Wenzhouxiangella sp. XN79A]|uniref:serine hydrolase domain-containing protein n=1 Tax=Wenzhouxiangella sp. XN79A TaxID=2724193 RepID=UPI00144A5DF8|nr:serine hydrolase [Wenzhouxiangella sp. XN79A]NKI33720.1 serine hydrolase [Wenzhouxiangella sp. XN79A]
MPVSNDVRLRSKTGPALRLGWLLLLLVAAASASADDAYVPPPGQWSTVEPANAGFDPQRLARAVAAARAQAVTEPTDLHQVLIDSWSPREPNYRVLGPTRPRGGDSGLILRGGRIVAEWGDVHRVDMTFSVVKSYLATIAALALDDRRIPGIDARVAESVPGPWFEGEHNGAITWRHLLNQTSDWSGTLWDVPDWADRPEGDDPEAWPDRPLHPPGSRFKYNDVRVNLAALALLQVHRQPLPVVLRTRIMDPIGASPTWRWHGYGNSWIELDGLRMQSVSGGGHFGGGLFISTRDHARFGLLMLRRGVWGERRLLSNAWFDLLREPVEVRPDYGLMWWLNTDRERIPAAPASAYWAAGFGGNSIYIDECNDLVVVLRWIPALEGVITGLLEALRPDQRCDAG